MTTETAGIPTEEAVRDTLRAAIQKVATGPEYSKDLPYEEATGVMRALLSGDADPVQAGVYLIALRMKRETDDENRGSLQAILEATDRAEAAVDELLDIADPYDGFTRGLPVSPFLPAVLAALGVPAFSHGLETVGPKYGITHRKVLRAAGVDVDRTPEQVAAQLADPDIGWGYVDQSRFCAPLYALLPLRQRIVKRPVLTTVEVLAHPIRARRKTHFMSGYVHKPYPRIYALLARHTGFDSMLLVRGVEGGIVPSLKQASVAWHYHAGGEERPWEVEPQPLGIESQTRAVPLPPRFQVPTAPDAIGPGFDVDEAAQAAAEAGLEALDGAGGPARDSLVYAGALALKHLGRYPTLLAAAQAVREVLASGAAKARFEAAPRSSH